MQSPKNQPVTNYGPFHSSQANNPPPYQQGYQTTYNSQGETAASEDPYAPPQGTSFPHHAQHLPPPFFAPPPARNTEKALLTEIFLSLFGIFGIGWIMAGETTLGAILVVCSFFIYWPLMILGTAFTIGLGLLCLAPLAIAAIIINALLLNTRVKRKAQFFAPPSQPYTHHMRYPHQ